MEGIKIRPLFDNVVVKVEQVEEKSKTGIIITGSDNNPALTATVVSVGKEVEGEINVGDKIMYAPFSGRELGGFLILAIHDIMGVVIEEVEEEKIHCPICKQVYPASQKHAHKATTVMTGGSRKMECQGCGTEGYPVFGQACPNCGEKHFKVIK